MEISFLDQLIFVGMLGGLVAFVPALVLGIIGGCAIDQDDTSHERDQTMFFFLGLGIGAWGTAAAVYLLP